MILQCPRTEAGTDRWKSPASASFQTSLPNAAAAGLVDQDLRGVNVADLMRHGSGAVDARGLVASLIADTSACQCRHLVMPGDWPDLPDLPDLPCPVWRGPAAGGPKLGKFTISRSLGAGRRDGCNALPENYGPGMRMGCTGPGCSRSCDWLIFDFLVKIRPPIGKPPQQEPQIWKRSSLRLNG